MEFLGANMIEFLEDLPSKYMKKILVKFLEAFRMVTPKEFLDLSLKNFQENPISNTVGVLEGIPDFYRKVFLEEPLKNLKL